MFGFLKNKSLEIATADLDKCLHYLFSENNRDQSEKSAGRILSTIGHYLNELMSNKSSLADICNHFTSYKNNVITSKKLSNHKDIDFSESYVMLSFFTLLADPKSEVSKKKDKSLCVAIRTAPSKTVIK